MSVHKTSLVFFCTFNVLPVSPMWGAAGSAKPSLPSTGRVGMGGGWVGVTLWVIGASLSEPHIVVLFRMSVRPSSWCLSDLAYDCISKWKIVMLRRPHDSTE